VGSEAEVMCHSAIDLFSFLGVADFITKLRTGRFWATRTFDSFFCEQGFWVLSNIVYYPARA